MPIILYYFFSELSITKKGNFFHFYTTYFLKKERLLHKVKVTLKFNPSYLLQSHLIIISNSNQIRSAKRINSGLDNPKNGRFHFQTIAIKKRRQATVFVACRLSFYSSLCVHCPSQAFFNYAMQLAFIPIFTFIGRFQMRNVGRSFGYRHFCTAASSG